MTRSDFFKTVLCWPTFISIIGISILISLGTWQLYRMKEKEHLLEQIAKVIEKPAQPLDHLIKTLKEPPEFHKITVQGVFDPDIFLRWMARPYKGEIGYHAIVPFHLTSGGVLLVDQGWAPQHMTPAKGSYKEETLLLMVRKPQKPSVFVPSNNLDKGEIYSIQPKEIAKSLGIMTLLPYYGVRLESPEATYSQALPPRLNLPNNHLSYALTWYFLALALAIIYVMYIRRRTIIS